MALFTEHFQVQDSSGAPISGAQLSFFQATTVTPITVYQDAAFATPHATPVVADTTGTFAPIYVKASDSPYKFVLKDAASVVVQTVDNVVVTGALQDGSAAAPAVYSVSDSDTGFFRSASGQWDYSSNGTATVRFRDRAYTIVSGTERKIPYYLDFSATYDPPNLADGAGVTTAISANGALANDYVIPNFTQNLSGITLTAYCRINDAIDFRFQNETGGALDLASGTLSARVIR